MTEALIQFVEANPTDKRVVKIMAAMNRSLSLNGNVGKLIGELMRELDAK
jgi:hypothetical protein